MKLEHLIVGALALQEATAQWRPDLKSAVDSKFELSDVVLWGCMIGGLTFVGCCVTFCMYMLCKKKPIPYTDRHNHALSGTVPDRELEFQTFRQPPPTYEEAIASLEFA